MRPARFAYHQPESIREAVDGLRAHGSDACVLAGGQSLLPLLHQRALRPDVVIDVKRLTELRYVEHDDAGGVRVGALTRHVDVERLVDRRTRLRHPVLPASAPLVGSLPVRTRGTIGGSIAHADPCSEWCVLALLLDADVVVEGAAGRRTIGADAFFSGAHVTALTPEELVVELRLPAPAPTATLAEFAVRDGEMALVVAAAAVTIDANGQIASARIALGGVADRPVRVPRAEQAIVGCPADGGLLDCARRVVAEAVDPPSDFRAGAPYRRELAATLVARALAASVERGRRAGIAGELEVV
jgi:carbon-monoxide dehydrogenase medium subunit